MAFLVPLVSFLFLQRSVSGAAVPTWPNYLSDELEDIMFLNTGYRAKQFSKEVTPCSFSSQGVGRIAAAEWLRTSFHDVATANTYSGKGGIDASLVYELNSGENVGNAFNTTLTTYEPFFGPRASMADIVALGTYTSVRSCGGLPIPIRPGRVDAMTAGDTGVPQPQNAIGTFRNQFARMGFTGDTEMIQVTACGHTIGGVHSANFPLIVAPPTNQMPLDSTQDVFDEKVATEYIAGTTADPLVVGLSQRYSRNSDLVIFNADKNATIRSMTNPKAFQTICQAILQKMIEIVPKGVQLGDAVVAYEVKPYALQLYLLDGGQKLAFSGEIRVRTTNRAATSIMGVQLIYKDRNGNSCNGCSVSTQVAGSAAGFDDSFTFYNFATEISSSASISSFTVQIGYQDGTTEKFDNNGSGYPIQDSLLFQYPQSCPRSSSSLTVTAAVRNNTSSFPKLNVVTRSYRAKLITPLLNTTTVSLNPSSLSVGPYAIYNITVPLNATQTSTALFNLTIPSTTISTDYQAYSLLPSTCSALSSKDDNSSSPTAYTSLGCVTDPVNPRALSATFYYSSTSMTIQSCATYCATYALFGTEYSGECYCGNSLSTLSTNASESDCHMPCSGSPSSICGGSGRLSLYQNTAYTKPSNPTYSDYTYLSCYTDNPSSRTLSAANMDSQSLSVQSCASYCAAGHYAYMGTEYHNECYCGNTLPSTSVASPADEGDCSATCAGNSSQTCGGSSRLSLYRNPNYQKAATPSYDGYVYQGCYPDRTSSRTLDQPMVMTSRSLTTQQCADYCFNNGPFTYMGTEYSGECYCSNTLNSGNGAVVDDAECGSVCSGASGEACGGADRVSLYARNGTVGRRSLRFEARRSGAEV